MHQIMIWKPGWQGDPSTRTRAPIRGAIFWASEPRGMAPRLSPFAPPVHIGPLLDLSVGRWILKKQVAESTSGSRLSGF